MRLPTRLLQRKLDAHKGDFGHIFILAGSPRYSGAAVLCAASAMRSGAGLVTLGIPKGLNSAVIKIKPLEVMTLPLAQTAEGNLSLTAYPSIIKFARGADVLVLGPGMGQEDSTARLIRKLVSKLEKPLIIDADALNAIAHDLLVLQNPGRKDTNSIRILTPHYGEMSRLSNVPIGALRLKPKEIAKQFAKKYKAVVVLKGHKTIVADFAQNVYTNTTGNPGMATAGSGDVLAGMIGAFLGQGLSAFNAAKFAVYLHGLAGDLAAKEKTQPGMIASDMIDKIPESIKMSS